LILFWLSCQTYDINIDNPVDAIANAENNHSLDVDRLYIDEAYVGKNMVMKRWRPRARGRAAKILKPFSQITIILKEKIQKED